MSIPNISIQWQFDPDSGELLNEKEILSTGLFSRQLIEKRKSDFRSSRNQRPKIESKLPTLNGNPVEYNGLKERAMKAWGLKHDPRDETLKEIKKVTGREITTGLSSMLKALASKKADASEQERRKKICEGCTKVDEKGQRLYREIDGKTFCGEPRLRRILRDEKESGCGCALRFKWLFTEARCPLGLW